MITTEKIADATARADSERAEAERLDQELFDIDAVLARRPALDGLPSRREKIEHAIKAAARADAAEERVRVLAEAMRPFAERAKRWEDAPDGTLVNVYLQEARAAARALMETGEARASEEATNGT